MAVRHMEDLFTIHALHDSTIEYIRMDVTNLLLKRETIERVSTTFGVQGLEFKSVISRGPTQAISAPPYSARVRTEQMGR